MDFLIEIKNLNKSYNLKHAQNIEILKNISINFKFNCCVCLLGPSGSGKSTFLNVLGLLDKDYEGEYIFKGYNVKSLKSNEINKIRGLSIGFVHQFFHLIPELNVIENVMLPNLINKNDKSIFNDSKKILDIFGLSDRIFFKPIKLSGGEQQRVAIARSLINNPDLIIADEMTGNLDEYTSREIFDFFINYIKKNNKSLIFATHNKDFSKKASEIFYIKNKELLRIND